MLPFMSLRRLVPCLALLFLISCSTFEDNGTHLAYALEKSAKELRASAATGTVVRYEPLGGASESYYVEITPSYGEGAQQTGAWGSYLVVSGRHSGGTSYHNRFVFVPSRLYVQKSSGTTELILRKDGDRISVVEIR